MRFSFVKNTLLIVLPLTMLICFSCGSQNKEEKIEQRIEKIEGLLTELEVKDAEIMVGANQFSEYKKLLIGKKTGVVGNQTSITKDTLHLVDFLLSQGIALEKIFSPEHGFRGTADAGAEVKDGKDTKTGLPIFSLHGKNRKPTPEQMQELDVMVFDIQDVGVRFYTYLSTLHYVMEACAEANIPLIVLDRPNPNAHYIDGPMMEPANTGFLGLHPVPLVYGMTIGEYAQMINGEGWLKDKMQCDLTVIPVKNYTHQMSYSLPVRPSPNLPNDIAINLYPSLGLLEGTNLNAGRGTEMQFQVIGSPYLPKEKYPFTYTPQPNFGSSNPKFKGILCNGLDLRNTPHLDKIDLTWIIEAYHNYSKKEDFFNTKNFTAHAGTSKLQEQIEAGLSSKEISESWKPELEQFKKIREKYVLYE
ncbi:MAG: DUF1343 domain-containing protein [Flavobacteriaceae bacterium]